MKIIQNTYTFRTKKYNRNKEQSPKRRKNKRKLLKKFEQLPNEAITMLNVCLPLVIINLLIFTVKYLEMWTRNSYGANLFYEPLLPDVLFPAVLCVCLAFIMDIFRARMRL